MESLKKVTICINNIGQRSLKTKTTENSRLCYPLFDKVIRSWVSGGADIVSIDYMNSLSEIDKNPTVSAFVHLTNINYRLFWYDIERSLENFHCILIYDGIYEHRCIFEDWDGSYILGGYCETLLSEHTMYGEIVHIDR